jgi:hypothetical protein
MRQSVVVISLVLLLACNPAGPGLGIDEVQGSFCPKGKADEVIRTGETWLVTIYYNASDVRDARDEDDVVHQIEFRNCASEQCNMDGALTADQAKTNCPAATNLPAPNPRSAKNRQGQRVATSHERVTLRRHPGVSLCGGASCEWLCYWSSA